MRPNDVRFGSLLVALGWAQPVLDFVHLHMALQALIDDFRQKIQQLDDELTRTRRINRQPNTDVDAPANVRYWG